MRPNFKRVATYKILTVDTAGNKSDIAQARILSYPNFTLEFEKKFDLDGVPDETRAKIFNPSPDTVKAFFKQRNRKTFLIIEAGYEADSGLMTQGEVVDFVTDTVGNDRILTAIIHDRNALWQNTMITKTFSGIHSASSIINSVLADFGIPGTIDLGTDKNFEDKSINSTLRRFLNDMAKETLSDFFMSDARMIFQPRATKGKKVVFVLSPDTGLIDRPEKTTVQIKTSQGVTTREGLKIKSLFNYRFRGGDTIQVKFREIDQTFRIYNGIHMFQDKDAFSELEVA